MTRWAAAGVIAFAATAGAADKDEKPVVVSKDLEARAKKLIAEKPGSEAALMADAILKGSQLGPGEGWFKSPAQKRHDWKWLAARYGVANDKPITRKAANIREDLFDLIDRDGDEEITAADLDWSPSSPFVRQMQMAAVLFRPADRDGNGRVSAEEWAAIFKRGGGKELSQEGVRRLLFPKPPKSNGSNKEDDGPSPDVLLKGLFAGEIGSMQEGPKVGEKAPDFTLKNADGQQTIRLAEQIGKRPVVLIFGNFTCGPFRSWGQTLAELAETHKDRATFLGVYVREAHPTDGWHMEQNERAGIALPQPKTNAERNAVAARCERAMKWPYPLLVDDVNDAAGHAYSGMPARLYVIDEKGIVTYKSARGPFGFRPQEMEQALALTLLEATPVGPASIGSSAPSAPKN